MLSSLVKMLRSFGLDLDIDKTKVFTTEQLQHTTLNPLLLPCDNSYVEVVPANGFHKYLGRAFPGDLTKRGEKALEHRLGCAWQKFNHFKHVYQRLNND